MISIRVKIRMTERSYDELFFMKYGKWKQKCLYFDLVLENLQSLDAWKSQWPNRNSNTVSHHCAFSLKAPVTSFQQMLSSRKFRFIS